MKTYWDIPQGELYRFNSKEELVYFMNKTQIHSGFDDFNGNDSFGISVRLIPDEPDCDPEDLELGLVDGEYACEHLTPTEEEPFYKLTIHQPNPYSTEEEQYASQYGNHFGTFILKPEDVILDERWVFPCNVFIWLERGADRLGGFEIKLFCVTPVGKERTVQGTQEYEDSVKERQISILNKFIEYENQRDKKKS